MGRLDFTAGMPVGVSVSSSPAGFAKTSTGSLTTFSSNAGRRTDLGIMFEPSETNLWLSNIDQSTAQWSSPSLGTVTQDNATAPDGTLTADSFLESAVNGQHCPYPAAAISVSGSTNYTVSAYVKSTGGRNAYIQIANQSFSVASVAFFDLTNGVATVGTALAGGGFSGQSAGIEAANSGWWRIWFTVNSGSASAFNPFIGPCTGTGPADSRIYTGDVTKGLVQWGNEIKLGTVPSTLIVTTSTSATRAADVITWTMPSGGTILTFTFDDNSTQTVSASPGAYTFPTNLNRKQIKYVDYLDPIGVSASQTIPAFTTSGTIATAGGRFVSAAQTIPDFTTSATVFVAVDYGITLPTASDIIAQTLRRVGAVGVGQTPDAYHSIDCLKLINMMLAQWNRRRWLIWHLKDIACTATGAQTYTVGIGQQFNTPRPDKIEFAFVRQTGTMAVDIPLDVIRSREDYNDITLKAFSAFPRAVFYDQTYPTGTLYVWPLPPNNSYEIHIVVKDTLTSISSLSDLLVMPAEYQEAICLNLALRLYPYFGMKPDPELVKQARAALELIRNANAQLSMVAVDPILLGAMVRRPGGGFVATA